MPKIQWAGLPPALRDHLFERLRERKITVEELYQLKVWRESEPDAPDGPWYKDFGTFKICGEGRIRQRSCSEASRPKGNNSKGTHQPAELASPSRIRELASHAIRTAFIGRVWRRPDQGSPLQTTLFAPIYTWPSGRDRTRVA